MAPFVEREWGEKATRLMWRVKELADPDGVLNPGVVLNGDPEIHMRDLKSVPPIEDAATACVECGFCEPVCPSRDLTTTPRQRIVLRREMARQPEGSPVLEALLREYEYDGIQTCAADGTCMLSCPVGIDTGKLIKGFRQREHTERAEKNALKSARHWGAVEHAARGALRTGGLPGGNAVMGGLSRAWRTVVSDELVPEWPANMPRPGPARLPKTSRDGAAAVYVPACINRIFGRARGDEGELTLPEALVAVSERAGLPVWIPEDVAGHCCAVPWTSKGYSEGAAHMANRMTEAMWRWSGEGEIPIVTDATSCALGLSREALEKLTEENRERHGKLEVLDSIAWTAERLLPRLEVSARVGKAVVHPTCAARHLNLLKPLETLAGALADDVLVPINAKCCGFAGDRGFLHPELTASATREEAAEIAGGDFDAHLCANRTCEIGLQQATGDVWTSVVYLLEELTRAGSDPDTADGVRPEA
jgi:D-lactate dehydrogenase